MLLQRSEINEKDAKDGPILNGKETYLRISSGPELWSSGNGRRLVFKKSWLRIPAPDTVWNFFTFVAKIELSV